AYGWVTLVIVLLVAMEKIPDLGAMKKAEKRAKNGQVRPDGATDVDFGPDVSAHTNPTMGLVNFLLPMIVLVAASWYFGIDLLAGVFVALIFTISFYGAQKLISMNDMFEAVYDGIKVMLLPLATVIGGFMLKSVNDSLGVTQHLIETVSPYLSAFYFPAIIFMITGALV
ncbi:Na+/H+ antiporter NhaC family protein, partial [Vibrio parahaemolyticus]|nr:Na+/H+ antiporter NhaC family protein [Vibrio parahaemolyticus]